jgi:F-box interacting protein
MGESSSNKRLPLPEDASILTEDLVIEILSRLPYSSLCRFKCVSKSWLVLCSDPEIRKKSTQTLSGFFYMSLSPTYTRQFTNLSGRGQPMVEPSFPILPNLPEVRFMDCSNGLLLCLDIISPSPGQNILEMEIYYIVCNPATHEWVMLPNIIERRGIYNRRLGFDPTVSPHFTVFLIVCKDYYHNDPVIGVEIYSSETGVWTYKESEWDNGTVVGNTSKSVFFDGVMHFTTSGSSLVTVDKEGKTWRKIPTPYQTLHTYIGVSQGHLYSVNHDRSGHKIAVWVLEDYDSGQWILKYTFSTYDLPEPLFLQLQPYNIMVIIAVHPERNLIYLAIGPQRSIISIDMDSRAVHAIRTLGHYARHPYLPYIPCFSEWLFDGH